NEVTRYLSRFFRSILWILVAYALGYLGLSLIKEGSFLTIDWTVFAWLFVSVVLTLLAYPLIPLLERLFGFTSNITLSELADLDRPLLRELGVKAAGTMQHSLQVGNLSEAAVDAIGGNTLLVKVAALYHDIGKMKNPAFFIENQVDSNPHDAMPEVESAGIIIDHVTEGEKMARKHNLPNDIIRFITTHHGTTRVEYFYRKHLEKFPNGEPSEPLFRYRGPKPSTREETVLMLADSIEAACKSLKEPSEQKISEMVDSIITKKVSQDQLIGSGLTFEELEKVRTSFKSVLKSIYHIRIEYPAEPINELASESKDKLAQDRS
ncbi:MAG: HDIG domain-containing protein, partial [Saprospiraceae bacterium]|nr:HDIG domain-containing protein [Saprospiraceae bacterium]